VVGERVELRLESVVEMAEPVKFVPEPRKKLGETSGSGRQKLLQGLGGRPAVDRRKSGFHQDLDESLDMLVTRPSRAALPARNRHHIDLASTG
jgi:hypothetical protein